MIVRKRYELPDVTSVGAELNSPEKAATAKFEANIDYIPYLINPN